MDGFYYEHDYKYDSLQLLYKNRKETQQHIFWWNTLARFEASLLSNNIKKLLHDQIVLIKMIYNYNSRVTLMIINLRFLLSIPYKEVRPNTLEYTKSSLT